jgi:rare lipoprotein A
LIDLSYAASYRLGLAGKGSGIVDVEAIDARKFVQSPQSALADNSAVVVEPLKKEENPAPTVIENSRVSAPKQEKLSSTPSIGLFVQVGAFKSADNAGVLSKKILAQNLVENTPVNSWYNQGIYRVRIGPYVKRAEAELAAANVKKALGVNTYIIDQP